MSNYRLIAIEGIDRIGKSTFIKELHEIISKEYCQNCTIEKPTIGLNTINKDYYPLRNIEEIFEIRNIGLFEEFLFQANHFIQNDYPIKCILRDRFHLSELTYGKVLRFNNFKIFGEGDASRGFECYQTWNNWFEQNLLETGIDVFLITFVLDGESIPNKDEVEELTIGKLKLINEEFRIQHEKSILPKKIISLKKDKESGLTNIKDYLKDVLRFINL